MNDTNKFLDGYVKIKIVGQGAFGRATLYQRTSDGKQMVMKEVFTMDMDESEKKSALNEVAILSNLNHPNIIRYLGSFEKENSFIIIMEYADGGNLAQLINAKKNKNEIFTEVNILKIISQITSALSYMHSNKILHRDLKTANIFLNMNGSVKVGDFGISKMLNTKSQAQTVVGTPYYLSPEMCEGHDYNEKSDIWAIGCIVYELASLKKPFEAPTLPVLVQKITVCEYKGIPDFYSEGLSRLVYLILQKDPNRRPSAKYINEIILPRIAKKDQNKSLDTLSTLSSSNLGVSKERSILFKMCNFIDDQKIVPVELPHKIIIDFSVSQTHHIAITADNEVYTWGDNNHRQLSLGEITTNKEYPTYVPSLRQEKITQCSAGVGFSIFLNENGLVYSCGDGRQGCLGHGDWTSLAHPVVIKSLRDQQITQISCGNEHVVALSMEGRVFTWGSSKNGQLGQGHNQYRCKPLAIRLPNAYKIQTVFCGKNATILLTTAGLVLVSGDNRYHKLGITDQDKISIFTHLQLTEKIKTVSMGPNHTIMVTDKGNLVVMGRNFEAQLGKGDTGFYNQPQTVKMNLKVTMVACGFNFTVAADNMNTLWLWGYCLRKTKSLDVFNNPNNVVKNRNNETMIVKTKEESGYFEECVKNPTSILALYACDNNVKSGCLIQLKTIKAEGNNLFLITHTSAPPPVRQFTSNNLHYSKFVQHGDTSASFPYTMNKILPSNSTSI